MKATPQLAQALANLRGNRDFAAVLEGLKEHVKEETRRCVDAEGAVQLRASGAVKALEWWQGAFESAPKDLEKFKSQLQPQGK